MQEMLVKNTDFKKNAEEKSLTFENIENYYSFSLNTKNKIGLEYERISLDKTTHNVVKYEVISSVINKFCQLNNWEKIYDENTLIGAKDKNSTTSISLEPANQFEISLEPKENILDIELELNKIIKSIDRIKEVYNLIFLGYGINPKQNLDEIPLLNKKRYKIMNEYLPKCLCAELSQKMMRKTAGIQINIDCFSIKDVYLKLKFFNLIMPFMSALCANSPLEDNKLTPNQTNRALVWKKTGKQRCNFFYKNIFNKHINKEKNLIKNYINEILNVPMIYFERKDEKIILNGKINFLEFMKNGYRGYYPNLDDYILHQSLVFPDVRLKKNYIEIRNHDSSSPQFALCLCAFYKGLTLGNFDEYLKEFDFLNVNEVDFYNDKLLLEGLNFKITNKINGWKIIERLFDISSSNLSTKERSYLKILEDMIKERKTQADYIIDYGIKNSSELVEYLTNL